MMATLCAENIISEDQFKKFGHLFSANILLQLHHLDFPPEEIENYNGALKNIASYYGLMCEFVVALTSFGLEDHDAEQN